MEQALQKSQFIILDGGLGSELDRQGVQVGDSELWSAALVASNPQVLEAVHTEFLDAGADVITTASYQASVPGFIKYIKEQQEEDKGEQGSSRILLKLDENEIKQQALKLIEKSVQIAIDSRDHFWNRQPDFVKSGRAKPLVAASVGPYGAYLAQGQEYTGDYGLQFSTGEAEAKNVLRAFHEPRLQALLQAKPDILALETIPNVIELEVLLDLVSEYRYSAAAASTGKSSQVNKFPDTWLAFSVNTNNYTSLADGTPLDSPRVLGAIASDANKTISAIGANCLPLAHAAVTLSFIRTYLNTHGLPELPLVVYPNSGEVYNGITKEWHEPAISREEGASEEDLRLPTTLAAGAKIWKELGARLIGGCCRTRPSDIRVLREALLSVDN